MNERIPTPSAPRTFAPASRSVVNETTLRRASAVVAFGGSFATTWLFVDAIGVGGWLGVAVAALAEIVLWGCKTTRTPALRWSAHGLDTLLNGGGLWAFVQALPATTVWAMLTTGLGLSGELSGTAALVIALGAGLVLSVAPHALWRG